MRRRPRCQPGEVRRNDIIRDEILSGLAAASCAAAGAILACRAAGMRRSSKSDGTPVTDADRRAHDMLIAQLADRFGDLPVLSEESAAGAHEAQPDRFLLVDPLDGTADFIAGSAEFTVNIALVERGRPVAGLIHAPLLGRLYLAGSDAMEIELPPGASLDANSPVRTIRHRPWPAHPVAMVSRSHKDAPTERLCAALGPCTLRPVGSALKFVHLASGHADVYVRAAPLCEWDVAAGDALIHAAGGAMRALTGQPITYGWSQAVRRVPPFVAVGEARMLASVLEALRGEAAFSNITR